MPAALSVCCMNPGALQTTSGVVYGGRARTQLDIHDSTYSWKQFAEDFVAFNSPALIPAAQLAMESQRGDAVPYNMAALADFRTHNDLSDGSFTWNSGSGLNNEGFAPIVVFNPDHLNLQFIVTVEYRTRFPVSNVAMSTHRRHVPSSEATWSKVQGQMDREGHGMKAAGRRN